MWIKSKDLQDMLDDAKRAGHSEGRIEGKMEERMLHPSPFETPRRLTSWELDDMLNFGHSDERKLVNVSFEYKGTRTTFRISDTVKSLEVNKQDGRLLIKVCKFDRSIVHYDYELSRINSEIRKEYK